MAKTLKAGAETLGLFRDLEKAKAEEAAAKEKRIALERRVVETLQFAKDEGSKTFNFETHKIKLTGNLNRRLDRDKWAEVRARIPEDRWPIKTKEELVDKGVRWLKENDPDNYRVLCEAMTVAPGKTSVDITPVVDQQEAPF
jgi:hypothetical protein